ncbi:MAG: cysteine hydrolase family protein [Thermoplasmata archaeon]
MYAILIVDMIHEFVDGKFGSERVKKIVPKVKELIEYGRKMNWTIVYAKDSHEENDPELKVWGKHAMKGSYASEIIDELKPELNDIVIEKRTYSAFYNTELERILKEKNIQKLIVAGVSTDICVLHTVSNAFFAGFETYVVEECTDSIKPKNKEFGLKYMMNMYGTKLIRLKDLGVLQ